MKRTDFQISIDAQPVIFTVPPVLKAGVWWVHLESFAKQLGLKDEAGRMVKAPFNISVADKEVLMMLEKWLSDPDYNAVLLHNLKQ